MRTIPVILGLLLASCSQVPQRQSFDLFDALSTGTWDFEGNVDSCENPTTHWFPSDRQRMYATRPEGNYIGDGVPRSVVEYEIVSVSDFEIAMNLVQEIRRDNDGRPIQWTIVMLSQSEYCWRPHYWSVDECSGVVSRCPHETASK